MQCARLTRLAIATAHCAALPSALSPVDVAAILPAGISPVRRILRLLHACCPRRQDHPLYTNATGLPVGRALVIMSIMVACDLALGLVLIFYFQHVI